MSNGILTIKETFNSGIPSIQKILKVAGGKEYLMNVCIANTTRYIQLNFPGTQNVVEVAGDFTKIIIDTRPDWKEADLKLFFDYLLKNPSLIREVKHVGNIITPMVLLQLVEHYEGKRSETREEVLKETVYPEPVSDKKEDQPLDPERAKVWLDKIYEQIKVVKKPIVYKEENILRETLESHSQKIIESLPGKSFVDLFELYQNLMNHYTMEKEIINKKEKFIKVYLYKNVIDEIEYIFILG